MRHAPDHVRVLAALTAIALGSCAPAPIRGPSGPPAAPPIAGAARPAPAPTPVADEPPPALRLPTDARPTREALVLEIDPARDRFGGEARIELDLARPRRTLWLHGRGLDVTRATVETPGGPALAARWRQVDPAGRARLDLDAPVGPGPVVLRIAFTAPWDRDLVGLYRVEAGGRYHAFTQFEADYARRAFPCFDEPSFKHPWELTLVVPARDQALANTPVAEETPDPARATRRVRFRPTRPLPAYLVALAVGDLEIVDAPPIAPTTLRARPIPLRGVAVRGRAGRLGFALGLAADVIPRLEAWFGSAFPYDKIDLVAVPDFAYGAMENPGLVTFREKLLDCDAARSSVDQREEIATTMLHELAHQWFGDLVTLGWWDDVWLNESFASFMEVRVGRDWAPTRSRDVDLVADTRGAMARDALVSARAVRQPIASDDDIANVFDPITYEKGKTVLAMFERWMGPAAFQRGVRAYLEAHRDGTGTADELLAALGEAAGRDVAGPMRGFLDQAGVPLVETRVVCDAAGAGGTSGAHLELRQRRFTPIGSTATPATWRVPVCVRWADAAAPDDAKHKARAGHVSARPSNGSEHEACTLLEAETGGTGRTGPTGRIDLGPRCPAWVFPNADAAGYYRVAPSAEDLAHLGRHLGALRPRERAALASDLVAALEAGALDAAVVLPALEPFAADDEPATATIPARLAVELIERVADDDLAPAIAAWASRLYAPVLARLGWEARPAAGAAAEPPAREKLRADMVHFLVRWGRDPAVRAEAARRGRRWLGIEGATPGTPGDGRLHPDAVAPPLVAPCLLAAIDDGGAPVYDAALANLAPAAGAAPPGSPASPVSPEDRDRILFALGAVTAPALAARSRALVLDDRLRTSERHQPLLIQSGRRVTRAATWAWAIEHFDAILPRLSEVLRGVLPRLGRGFCDAARADEVDRFFAARLDRLPGGRRELAATVESIRLCSARAAAGRQGLRALFAARR